MLIKLEIEIIQNPKHSFVYIGSSIVIEEVRTLFFKCILEKTKGAKKELKRSKGKQNKGSKILM